MGIENKSKDYIKEKLRAKAEHDANNLIAQKEIFIDALVEVKKIMLESVTQNKAESVNKLTEQINELEKKYNLVDEVLRDVIKTIEFDV